MREILFRARRVRDNTWAEGYFVQHKDKAYIIWDDAEGFDCEVQVDPKTVGQFTGLVDKNGRKIFEGDVFKFSNRHGTWFRVVKFDSISMVDMYGDEDIVDGYDIRFYFEATHLKVELVGNIHDNPELLKKVENL